VILRGLMDNHGKHEPSAWSSSSMQVANSYLNSTEGKPQNQNHNTCDLINKPRATSPPNPVAGTLASYDEIKVAWCVKTDALDEHKQRRDIWALESNVQITTPEMYVCKLESRFGGEARRCFHASYSA